MTEPETAEAVSEVMSRYAPSGVAIEQIARDIQAGADEGAAAQLEPIVAVRAYVSLDRQRRREAAADHRSPVASRPHRANSRADVSLGGRKRLGQRVERALSRGASGRAFRHQADVARIRSAAG